MAHDIQKPISIPEPTNDVDALWASVKALKEAVEMIQGIRGNREYVLAKDLVDQLADIEIPVAGGGGGATQLNELTDVNTSTPTDRNVLVADGVDFESRALVEADISDLSVSTVAGLGIWRYRTETATPPASGQIRFDNANISAATEFYLHETSDEGTDMSVFLELMLKDESVLYIQDKTNADNHVIIDINSTTDNGTYRTYGIQSIVENGTEPSQNAQVALITSGSALSIIEKGTTNLSLATWDTTASRWNENVAASLNDFGLTMTSSVPSYTLNETDAGTDEKEISLTLFNGEISLNTASDVGGFGEYILRATRTGTAVNLVELHGDNLILKPDIDVQIEVDAFLTNDADLNFTDAGKILFGTLAGGEFSLGFDGNQTLELLDVSGSNSTFYLGGIANFQVNAETNGNSVVNIGEATTLRGSSSTGRVNFYNEVSSVIQTATLSHELGVFWLNGNNAKVQINAGTGKVLETNVDAIKVSEVAAAPADEATYGQFWVRDDVPNRPMFTDDTGVDFDLTVGTAEVNDLTAAVTWTNIPIANVPTGTTSSTVSLGNHTHDGITDTNLLDKSAAENIGGSWIFDANVQFQSSSRLQMNDLAIERAVLDDYSVSNTNAVVAANAVTLTYSSSQSYDLDLEAATGDVTVTISGGPPSTTYGEMIVRVQQDSTADRTLTWAGGTFRWPGGVEIEPQTGADKVTIYYLSTWDGGTNWYINGVEYDL